MNLLAVRRILPLSVSLALLLGAAHAEAAGVLDLDRVPASTPRIEVLGASTTGVLYKVSRVDGDAQASSTTWVKPAAGTPYQVAANFDLLAGQRIYGAGATAIEFQQIGVPVTRNCDSSPQPGALAPFGWIAASGERVEIDATGCRVTATYPQPDGVPTVADELGYVVVKNLDEQGNRQFTYHSYADPTHPHVIADAGLHRWPNGLALRGKVVTWSTIDTEQPDTTFVIRSSTDGSVPPVTTRVSGIVLRTSILGAATGWDACYFQSAVCASGSIGPGSARHVLVGTHSVFSDGTRFVFDTYGTPAGIDAATAVDPTTARTRIVDVPQLPAVAYSVALGAGGVAYVDTQRPVDSVNRRTYTRSGSTVGLSAQVRIGGTNRPVGGRAVSRDGRRTAFIDAAGVLWLVGDDGVRTRVFTSVVRDEVVLGVGLKLSGSRLLWTKGVYDGDRCDMRPPPCDPLYNGVPMLYDLRTGVSTAASAPAQAIGSLDLWGNYLAWSDIGNAVWRRDLASGAVVQAKAAGTARVNSVAVHDDYVAWSTCTPGVSSTCAASVIAHRNMTTRTAAIQLVSANTEKVRLSGGHVVYDAYANGFPPSGTLRVNRLGTSATGVVGPVRWRAAFDVHDETLAWVAPDDVARIGPNSPFVAYPKYLGNGSAPPSFDPALRVWNPEFGISKALPTCTLTIKSGTAVRRTLNCATPDGSARAVWDGRDSAGRLLPKGAYTWTLAGRDGDGTLRWWTGATHPITGTVKIV
ncbi:hypothetical protein [Kribbella endophytica]